MSEGLNRIARLAASLPLAASLGASLACATDIPFLPSTASPATTGRVNADLVEASKGWF